MSSFPLCEDCLAEYENPADRRYHAQPNACAVCGPQLTLHDGANEMNSGDPIADIVALLKEGKIIAIKGIGGFHLAVDPNNQEAVELLRNRKGRGEKPFALIARDVQTVRKHCHLSKKESELLESYQRPILLLKRKDDCTLIGNMAPNNQYLGFMLPYSPLHHLLLEDTFDTLVMTSANISEEPIAIDNDEALSRLADIADYFLLHNRAILERCDDSILFQTADATQMIRRSRGYVPAPVFVGKMIAPGLLAVGGEMKNAVALARDDTVFLSQYIGDLDNPKAYSFFEHSIEHLSNLLAIEPKQIVCDKHPEYLSTKWARQENLPLIQVQHHHAHMLSVMAENHYFDRTIGIILDGTGYGADGTIWGGEILVGDANSFERFAWLKPVPMPGGTAAINEPWRMAVSYLFDAYGKDMTRLLGVFPYDSDRTNMVCQMLEKKFNCPLTSSCGRLFDAVSALLGINSTVTYEAQAAIELEMAAGSAPMPSVNSVQPTSGGIDMAPLIRTIVEMIEDNRSKPEIAIYFHYQLAEILVAAAKAARDKCGLSVAALSGGVYQNRIFSARLLARLREEGFHVLQHKELPTNDGGLALGQIMVANAHISNQEGEA
jgi:hydrogenase maturation protein HypF